MPTSPTRRVRRGGALLSAAVLLGACQWGLTFTPGVATQGGTVTVSNEGGEPCPVPDGPPDGEGGDVAVFVVSSAMAVAGELPGSLEDLEGTSVHFGTTDADGFFSLEVPAPERPGDHLVVAICGLTGEEAGEPIEGIPAFGWYLDVLAVERTFRLDLDEATVADGAAVVATFRGCESDNDFDLAAAMAAQQGGDGDDLVILHADEDPAEQLLADLEELRDDHPVLEVYVDDELVTTVTADERYPAAIPVTLTLTGAGTHEIRGECSYQTVEVDEDLLADLLDDGFEPQALGVAAVEYPYELDVLGPLTWDWVDEPLVARAAVEVVAGAPAGAGADTATPPAQPVVAAPAYTG